MNEFDLMGYADNWSAKSGEKIEFKVSCSNPHGYSVQLGRLQGPISTEENDTNHFAPIDAGCNGRYAGRVQKTLCGSAAIFPPIDLNQTQGYTWFFFFKPSLHTLKF